MRKHLPDPLFTVAGLTPLMQACVMQAEAVWSLLGRPLNAQESKPYLWIIDAVETAGIQAECASMTEEDRRAFADLLRLFLRKVSDPEEARCFPVTAKARYAARHALSVKETGPRYRLVLLVKHLQRVNRLLVRGKIKPTVTLRRELKKLARHFRNAKQAAA